MSSLFLLLALGLLGPLLAWPRKIGLPVAVGEILVGVAFGTSGFNLVAEVPATKLISQVGFALVMMMVGSHIEVRQTFASKNLVSALRNIAISTTLALALAFAIVRITGIDHLAIYVLLMASSSAAVVLPLVSGRSNLGLLVTQVAVADLLGIIALPAVMEPGNTPTILIGALTVTALAAVIFVLLRIAARTGSWQNFREFSRERRFGLELRVSLLVLLGLASLAQSFGVSVMIAGFSLGLAIAANGVPHRLAKQLFAVTEGFFAPVFYVMLGASIDFRAVFVKPELVVLSGLLLLFSMLSHLPAALFGQSLSEAVLSSASLGIPTAVVSIGLSTRVLDSGEGAAFTLSMLLSVIMATIFARRLRES